LAELTNELSSTALSKSAATDAGATNAMKRYPIMAKRLTKAAITGGDSGIGRAVAIAFCQRGPDVLISYLEEHNDAHETERLVKEAGTMAVLAPADLKQPDHCRAVIAKAVSELGGIDILVNNAAHQATFNRSKIFPTRNGNWRSPAESPSCKQQSHAA